MAKWASRCIVVLGRGASNAVRAVRRGAALALAIVATAWGMASAAAADPTLDWTRQFGTVRDDIAYAVSADGLGSVYIAGVTQNDLNFDNDAWMASYDATGALLWTRQLGTAGNEIGSAVSADGLGSVYLAGSTNGNLAGPNAGSGGDAWVARYDDAGALLWTRQFGTTGVDVASAVSADGLGNVYVAGQTRGNLAGPNAGGDDAWVARYDATGTLLWTRQFGTTGREFASAISADGLGNVYVAGGTGGNLAGPGAGGVDAWVGKYDANGALLWTRQLGTTSGEHASAVSADGLGNVYVAGSTTGNLGGPNAGGSDAWLARYDAAGTLLWTRQFGTARIDSANAVSADGSGNVYVAGEMGSHFTGDFSEFFAHENFLVKYVDVIDAGVPGDFNGDGAVDGADFLAWQRHVGLTSGATRAQGDANADGRVDAADLALWKSNFDPATAAAALATPPSPVPEPSAWALAGPALALLLARNRGRVSPRRAYSSLGETRPLWRVSPKLAASASPVWFPNPRSMEQAPVRPARRHPGLPGGAMFVNQTTLPTESPAPRPACLGGALFRIAARETPVPRRQAARGRGRASASRVWFPNPRSTEQAPVGPARRHPGLPRWKHADEPERRPDPAAGNCLGIPPLLRSA